MNSTATPEAGFRQALAAVGNNESELARRLNIKPQSIQQWRIVPPLRVLEVERATGVSRHVLRPDLYPLDEAAAS